MLNSLHKDYSKQLIQSTGSGFEVQLNPLPNYVSGKIDPPGRNGVAERRHLAYIQYCRNYSDGLGVAPFPTIGCGAKRKPGLVWVKDSKLHLIEFRQIKKESFNGSDGRMGVILSPIADSYQRLKARLNGS